MIGTQPQLSTRHQFLRYWLPVIAYAVLMLALSTWPIRIRHAPFPYYDKVFHFFEYAVFALLWYRALRMTTGLPLHGWGWPGIVTFLVCFFFGAGDELYQSSRPYRAFDLYDFSADAAGAFAAIGVSVLKGMITRP
jgi:VanZ family protein